MNPIDPVKKPLTNLENYPSRALQETFIETLMDPFKEPLNKDPDLENYPSV